MSVYDDRLIEIAAQRRANATPTPANRDAEDTNTSIGGNGFGNVAGVFLIAIGMLGLPVSGGLSIVFIVGGFFAFGGGKITDDTERARALAVSQGDIDGANEASASGCGSLVLYIVIFVFLAVLVVAGAAGGISLSVTHN